MKMVVVVPGMCVVMIGLLRSDSVLATHTFQRLVDDECGAFNPPVTLYFYAEGPATYWHVRYPVTNAHNQCYMWTTTLDGNAGGPPVNRAWWYLDSRTDPSGSYYTMTYEPGTDNTCGNVYYNVLPRGDNGPNNSYYRSQAAGWTWITTEWFYPNLGGKIYLGDKQFCIEGSSITVDLMNWNKDHVTQQ